MRKLILLVAAASLFTSVGCGAEPVVGNWQSTDKLSNGARNDLWIAPDGSGDASLWATPVGEPNNWIRIDFKHDWTDRGRSTFELDMECDVDFCNGDDFTMDCDGLEQDNGSLILDCNGDGKWSNYVFNWEES